MAATTPSKTRIDAWDADLTEAQRWQVYDRLRRDRWYEVAEWAAKEYGLAAAPSRSAVYRFAARMQPLEDSHLVARSLMARDTAGALVAAKTDDEVTIGAWKAMAQDLGLRRQDDAALKYTKMALDLAAQLTKTKEIDLKRRAQDTRDELLKLAREKFEAAEQRLGAVREAVEDEALSPDEVQKRIKSIFGLKN